ncbi:MAG: Rpn family recombination-promoting nuclease/putative transposase [Myxococcales bacterium]|nr:Rpn family recombination-promoting nuclease/putative transposase [Myxococcales bacterium]MCB9629508.1 Rpn family recombination-promoting nuclease/putative transposase [Sandaracinaceae bacterium]
MGDYDTLFKRIFAVPANAAAELRCVLPAVLLAALDLSRLEHIPGTFVGPDMAHRHTDLLFRVPLGGRLVYLYLLMEHQSRPDPLMPLRVLEYLQRVWSKLLRNERGRKTLPPVLTLIVHHGPGGWTAPRSLHEMVEGLDEFPQLRPFVPNLELLIDDLAHVSDSQLLARPLTPVPRVAIWLLRDGRKADALLAHLPALSAELHHVLLHAPDDARVFLRYILQRTGPPSFDELRRTILENVPAAEAPLASIADQLRQEGVLEGLRQGTEQGRARALRDTLRSLLGQRFGALDGTTSARIDAADADQLQRLIGRVLSAASLGEVFEPH